MELKEGMYVRTKDGSIRKCITIDFDEYEFDEEIYNEYGDALLWLNEFEVETYISKITNNIIDLIEEGDYVNGFPVIHKENDILKCGLLVQFKENEIKSIVTKECFESMSYKVEE